MGSSFNPIKIVSTIFSETLNVVKYTLQLKLDKALGSAIHVVLPFFEDEYKTVIDLDFKVYNLLGSGKVPNQIVNAALKSTIFKKDLLPTLSNEFLSGGAIRLRMYLNWAKRNSVYETLGINVSAFNAGVSEEEIYTTIQQLLGNVEVYPDSAAIGNIYELKFQVGLTYCLEHNINITDLATIEITDYNNGVASLILRNGAQYTFNTQSLQYPLYPNVDYAVLIYRPLSRINVVKEEEISLDYLPLNSTLSIFTKTFTYGEPGYSTYSVQDACDDSGALFFLVQDFTYEDESHEETVIIVDPEDEEESEEENENTEEPEEPEEQTVTIYTRTYTLTYKTINYSDPAFNSANDQYYVFNADNLTLYRYTKTYSDVVSNTFRSFWYRKGTGYPSVDTLWNRVSDFMSTNKYSWAPIITVRSFTIPITQNEFPVYYPLLQKTCKKLYLDKKFYSNLVKQLNDNESASHIDFGHIIFGVALNRKEDFAIEYICRFWLYISKFSSNIGTQEYTPNFKGYGSGTANSEAEDDRLDRLASFDSGIYGTTIGSDTVYIDGSYIPDSSSKRYAKKLSYFADSPTSIAMGLDWSLLWSTAKYETYFANTAPSKKCWIDYSYHQDATYSETGSMAEVGVAFYATTDATYAFLVTNMELDTSLFVCRHLKDEYISDNSVISIGEEVDSDRAYNSIPAYQDTAWRQANNIITSKFHICSLQELTYLKNVYGISSRPEIHMLNRIVASGQSLSLFETNGYYLREYYPGSVKGTFSYSDDEDDSYWLIEVLRERFGWSRRGNSRCYFNSPLCTVLPTNLIASTNRSVTEKYDSDGSYYERVDKPFTGCNVTYSRTSGLIYEIPQANVGYFKLADVKEISPIPAGARFVFNRQISGTYCERAIVTNIKIQNMIVSGYARVISAEKYFNYADTADSTCPFIIPLNYIVLRQMPLIQRNNVFMVASNMVINIFEKQEVHIKWYATDDFLTALLFIRVIITVIISVFTTPAGGATFLTVLQAVGYFVTDVALQILISTIISHIITIIAAIIVTKIVVKLTGNELLGTFAGLLTQFAMANSMVSAESLQTGALTVNPSSNVLTSLMKQCSDPKTWVELSKSYIENSISVRGRKLQNEIAELQQSTRSFQENYNESMNVLYSLNQKLTASKSTNLTGKFAYYLLSDPYTSVKTFESTANISSICEFTQGSVYNMYEITINPKGYV